MNQYLTPGDVVRFKSGGPNMTFLNFTDEGALVCGWFYQDRVVSHTFHPNTVILVQAGDQVCPLDAALFDQHSHLDQPYA